MSHASQSPEALRSAVRRATEEAEALLRRAAETLRQLGDEKRAKEYAASASRVRWLARGTDATGLPPAPGSA